MEASCVKVPFQFVDFGIPVSECRPTGFRMICLDSSAHHPSEILIHCKDSIANMTRLLKVDIVESASIVLGSSMRMRRMQQAEVLSMLV